LRLLVCVFARCGGFPANHISKVSTTIDPSTGEAALTTKAA
jgi:hypothetical protein